MADIYCYIKNSNLESCLKYGIKLSVYYHDNVKVNSTSKQYILGYLNPKDNLEKFNSDSYTCIRATLNNDYLFITDISLMDSSYFEEGLIPIEEYKFGTFRNPIVLIFCSILSNQINKTNKIIDVPVLYDSSEEIYLKNSIETLSNIVTDKILLEYLLDKLSKENKIEKIILENNNIVYKDSNGKIWT